MGSLRRVWHWFSQNLTALTALSGGLAALVAGLWAGYTHFHKPPDQPAPSSVVAQKVGDIHAGPGSQVTVSQQHISHINVPPEQIKNLVKEALAENTARLQQADPQEKEALLKERAALEAKYQDLARVKEEIEKKLAETARALEEYKQQFPAGQIEAAQQALTRGQTREAEQLFQTAFHQGGELAEKGKQQQAEAAYNLGKLAEARLDYAGARRSYEEAARRQPDNSEYVNAAGSILLAMGKYPEAAPYLEKALKIREQTLSPDDPDVAQSLNNLAALYRSQGQYARAEPLYQRALKIDEKALGPDHPDVATDLENYAVLLRKTGREKEAAAMETRARAIREQHQQDNLPPEPKKAEGVN